MNLRLTCIPIACLIALIGQPISAQVEPIDVVTRVEYEFGTELTYRATITAPAAVASASVFYRPAGAADTAVLTAEVSRDTPASAVAVQDLHSLPLPPFAAVEYWWQVELVDGRSVTSIPATFNYDDNRFTWQTLRSHPLSVHWTSGGSAFGQRALDLAVATLEQLQRDLAAPAPPLLRVYIYPSLGDLQAGLQLAGRAWSGAHADPTLGVVLIAAGPDSPADLERSLPHELTHVLLAERLGSSYPSLPAWLGEGLATLQEPAPDPAQRLALESATQSGSLIPIDSLCSAFPVAGDQALLAYAESAAIVQYLRDVYGSGSMAALLDAHAEGASCLGALERVYRRTPEQLMQEWQQSAFGGTIAPPAASGLALWSALLVPILILLVAGVAPRLLARRAGR